MRVTSAIAALMFGLAAPCLLAVDAAADDPDAGLFSASQTVTENELDGQRAKSSVVEGDGAAVSAGNDVASNGSSVVVGENNSTASASDNSAAAGNGNATVVNADGSEDVVAGNENTVGMADSTGTIEVSDTTVGDVSTGSISDLMLQDAQGITNLWANTGLFNNMINSTVVNVNLN